MFHLLRLNDKVASNRHQKGSSPPHLQPKTIWPWTCPINHKCRGYKNNCILRFGALTSLLWTHTETAVLLLLLSSSLRHNCLFCRMIALFSCIHLARKSQQYSGCSERQCLFHQQQGASELDKQRAHPLCPSKVIFSTRSDPLERY